MLISQRGRMIFIWCSCELVIHGWDSSRAEGWSVGNDMAERYEPWSQDQLEQFADDFTEGKIDVRD